MTKPDQKIWLDILSYLKQHHAEACRQWFEEIEPIGTVGGVFKVRVHQEVRQRYLERQCSAFFGEALQAVTGRLMAIRFVGPEVVDGEEPIAQPVGAALDEAPHHAFAEAKPTMNGTHDAAAVATLPARPRAASLAANSARRDSLVIVPDNTFDNFVVGPESRLAHAAAVAVASNPGKAYNPLFIHGGVGLGKTHLLQAICLQVMNDLPGTAIYYVSCEGFMTQFMEAVQAGQMNDFRHRFRDVDMLVIDDIHFLAKRDRTQEEFFHTFNSLYQAGKQIVLSSDAPPHEIPDLEQRLVSRFQAGLVVQVSPPCYETRVEIVKKKARLRGWHFPDDVACHIAASLSTNIRELEGAIVRVHAMATTDKRPISVEVAKNALGQNGSSGELRPETTITSIIDAVIDYYGVKLTDLQSKRRQKSIAHPRQVCMYLARKHTRYSLEEIGGYFGGRDHTTVMHAVRTVEDKKNRDADFGRVLQSLEHRFRPGMPGGMVASAGTAGALATMSV
jgi:chromosomal replication initiator protein